LSCFLPEAMMERCRWLGCEFFLCGGIHEDSC
jgi:hypothetical protein